MLLKNQQKNNKKKLGNINKYKQIAQDLKNKNEELTQEIKKLNVSHPNHTIKEEKKEYSDYLGENNNSETEEIFKLKKNYKILQEKFDEEVTRTEVLRSIAEGEKQKFQKVISKYQAAENLQTQFLLSFLPASTTLSQKLPLRPGFIPSLKNPLPSARKKPVNSQTLLHRKTQSFRSATLSGSTVPYATFQAYSANPYTQTRAVLARSPAGLMMSEWCQT